ncbi:hypothetical protein PF005_g8007 [Phytophthora fragariae]|uniref:Uncharacterized protein n=1 Tax=Phytophthora fragariae TaxID=53985 RepID=A0A6A3LBE5_9STRA|nr:hypothetical protein PF003_g20437 [Phytophthora fragariae]KAE8944683.1 hypothetical protein PF009_g5639 [Phytophthora fragariae]KAE9016772.1 hypothetical protein PF011_g6996 [Phytophthora fragariae]KAE9117309.1 hypothetical protein PF007_g9331 [Phytophthora fragariae]KAE9128687.1 hypothetical protein PF010_g4412 [Phytophthora fragariae]
MDGWFCTSLLLLNGTFFVVVASLSYRTTTSDTQSDTNPKLGTTTKRPHSPLLSPSQQDHIDNVLYRSSCTVETMARQYEAVLCSSIPRSDSQVQNVPCSSPHRDSA